MWINPNRKASDRRLAELSWAALIWTELSYICLIELVTNFCSIHLLSCSISIPTPTLAPAEPWASPRSLRRVASAKLKLELKLRVASSTKAQLATKLYDLMIQSRERTNERKRAYETKENSYPTRMGPISSHSNDCKLSSYLHPPKWLLQLDTFICLSCPTLFFKSYSLACNQSI